MAKSKGNYITIEQMLKDWDPEVFRIFVCSTHYRSDIDYNEKAMEEAKAKLKRIYSALEKLENKGEIKLSQNERNLVLEKAKKLEKEFIEAMEDDFNTPLALAKYLELASLINSLQTNDPELLDQLKEIYLRLGKIFGLFQKPREIEIKKELFEKTLGILLELREILRKEQRYELTDEIRKKLERIGIKLMDTQKGPEWKLEST